jgi:hypothetical protein
MEQPLCPQPHHHHHPSVIRIRTNSGGDTVASLGPLNNAASSAFQWTNPAIHIDSFGMSYAAWESLDNDHEVPRLNQEYNGDVVPSLVHVEDLSCTLVANEAFLPRRPRARTVGSVPERRKQHASVSSRVRSRSASQMQEGDDDDDDDNDAWSIYQCSFCSARTLQRRRRRPRCNSHQSTGGDYTPMLHESMSNLGASISSMGTVVCPECRFPSLE